jgi:hypothetical protein
LKPAIEKRALQALDDAGRELGDLRELLMIALARDDQPADNLSDPTHTRVRRLVNSILAISWAIHATTNLGRYVRSGSDGPRVRARSLPDCICCEQPAAPRPKRGMCGACYVAWQRSTLDDVSDFIRKWRETHGHRDGHDGTIGDTVS